ncbi:ABC transporter permease [Leuconostoc palmae]|uniref:ABC transporter permease n=1 Tax=Leuconostoc palmae TaxID=501487 RepID=UPI001C7D9453|nr:ABC transporter permease subunit [Leuconostoc palmae]
MLTLMKQEYYKAFKQNKLYIWLALSFVFPIAIMAIFKTQRTADAVLNFGQGTIYIVMAGIIFTAISVSQEFGFGTIRPLLSRRFSRGAIFTSKLLLNLTVYIGLFISAFVGTMIGQLLFVKKFNFADKAGYVGNGWQSMGTTVLTTLLEMFFIAALVLIITNLVKSSGAAIGLGVVMIVGTPILSSISSVLINMAPILKWNPFNIFLGIGMYNQLPHQEFKHIVHMSESNVIMAYVGYIIVMYGISYLIFRKRSV